MVLLPVAIASAVAYSQVSTDLLFSYLPTLEPRTYLPTYLLAGQYVARRIRRQLATRTGKSQ